MYTIEGTGREFETRGEAEDWGRENMCAVYDIVKVEGPEQTEVERLTGLYQAKDEEYYYYRVAAKRKIQDLETALRQIATGDEPKARKVAREALAPKEE